MWQVVGEMFRKITTELRKERTGPGLSGTHVRLRSLYGSFPPAFAGETSSMLRSRAGAVLSACLTKAIPGDKLLAQENQAFTFRAQSVKTGANQKAPVK